MEDPGSTPGLCIPFFLCFYLAFLSGDDGVVMMVRFGSRSGVWHDGRTCLQVSSVPEEKRKEDVGKEPAIQGMKLGDSVRIRLVMCKTWMGRNLECGLVFMYQVLVHRPQQEKAQLAKRLTRSPLSVQLSGLKSPANHCQRPTLGGNGQGHI